MKDARTMPEQPEHIDSQELRPDWLNHEEWPFVISALQLGDHSLSYTDTGGDGPTLLIVHVGMWSVLWRDVLVGLAPDYRCVTLDAPGSGLTMGPNRVGIVDAAEAIDAVVRHLDLDDITLVFHDLAGPASLQAATQWHDRVRGVVAVNTFGWRPSGAPFRMMLAVMGSVVMREIDVFTGWLPHMASTRFGVGRHWPRSTRRVFRRAMGHRGRRTIHRYMASVRRHDFSTVDSTVAKLSALPLLTVFGQRNDPLKFQPKWAERFDNITQVVVPKGNHFPMCDDPVLVAKSISDWHQSEVARPKVLTLT